MVDEPSEIQRLEFAAFKALTGAEYVRQRLIHGLSMGTPSVEDEAYLIKSRVKKVDSLVAKVLDRVHKGEVTYSPSKVRDIVGLRLLSLFKSDLPKLVRDFLSFVAWSQKPPFSLFYGANLKLCVAEIKIYATSDLYDTTTGFIVEEFEAYGFPTQSEPGAVHIEIFRKVSEYSSVHVVLWANGPNQSMSDRVPVEVQIRTSLEDVWGEIDHRLRYKSRAGLADAVSTASAERRSVDTVAPKELKVLKRNLDNCSDLADIVGMRLKTDIVERASISPFKKLISYDIDSLLKEIRFPETVARVSRAVEHLHGLYREIYQTGAWSGFEQIKGLADGFSEAISSLKKELDHSSHGESNAITPDGLRRLRMEIALCWYWRAVLCGSMFQLDTKSQYEKDKLDSIKQALKTYREVARQSDLPRDSVLLFRMANVITLQGDYDYALPRYEAAYKAIREDPRVPANHHFRVKFHAHTRWPCGNRRKGAK